MESNPFWSQKVQDECRLQASRRQGLLHYLWMEAGMKDLTMPELEDPFSFINRQQNLLGRDVEVQLVMAQELHSLQNMDLAR